MQPPVSFVQHGPGVIRLPEMAEPQQQQSQQPNRAKKPSFFSFGRKNKRSDPDSYRHSETTDTSGMDEPKGPPSNVSEPVLDVVQMIKEAKDKAGLGATDSSSRTSSPERERPQQLLIQPQQPLMQPQQPQMQQQQEQPRPRLPEPLDLPKQSDSSSDYDQRQNVLGRPLSPPKKSGGGFGSLFRSKSPKSGRRSKSKEREQRPRTGEFRIGDAQPGTCNLIFKTYICDLKNLNYHQNHI